MVDIEVPKGKILLDISELPIKVEVKRGTNLKRAVSRIGDPTVILQLNLTIPSVSLLIEKVNAQIEIDVKASPEELIIYTPYGRDLFTYREFVDAILFNLYDQIGTQLHEKFGASVHATDIIIHTTFTPHKKKSISFKLPPDLKINKDDVNLVDNFVSQLMGELQGYIEKTLNIFKVQGVKVEVPEGTTEIKVTATVNGSIPKSLTNGESYHILTVDLPSELDLNEIESPKDFLLTYILLTIEYEYERRIVASIIKRHSAGELDVIITTTK